MRVLVVDDQPEVGEVIARVLDTLGGFEVVAACGTSSQLDAELIKLDGSLTHSLEADPRRRSLASVLIEFGARPVLPCWPRASSRSSS